MPGNHPNPWGQTAVGVMERLLQPCRMTDARTASKAGSFFPEIHLDLPSNPAFLKTCCAGRRRQRRLVLSRQPQEKCQGPVDAEHGGLIQAARHVSQPVGPHGHGLVDHHL